MKSRLFLFFILFGLQPIAYAGQVVSFFKQAENSVKVNPEDQQELAEQEEQDEIVGDELQEWLKRDEDWFVEKDHSFTIQSLQDALKVFVLKYGASIIVTNVAYKFFGTSEWDSRQIIPHPNPIIICIAGPIIEEIIFRGLLDNGIDVIISKYLPFSSGKRDVSRGYLATILSSAFFAYGHKQEKCTFGPAFIGAFIGGVVYSRAVRSYNLGVPILVHMINNTIGMSLLYMRSNK